MVKAGEKYACSACGMEITYLEGCGCDAHPLVCCEKSMTRKVTSRPAAKAKTKG